MDVGLVVEDTVLEAATREGRDCIEAAVVTTMHRYDCGKLCFPRCTREHLPLHRCGRSRNLAPALQHALLDTSPDPAIQPIAERKVLDLGLEELFKVGRTWASHGRTSSAQHGQAAALVARVDRGIVLPENEAEDSVQTEQVEKVPGESRDPAHIQVWDGEVASEEGFKAQGKGEGELD